MSAFPYCGPTLVHDLGSLMKIGFLGPLMVLDEKGVNRVPTAPKERQLLALLLFHAGQLVTKDLAIEELWGGNPPRSAAQTLQTYVLHIRRTLRPAARPSRQIIITRDQGYTCDLGDAVVDINNFHQEVRSGRSAVAAGDDRRASARFHSALHLWRGRILEDIRTGPLLSRYALSLEESRLVSIEELVDAELRLGRHQQALGALSALAAAHPTHENLHARLMLALYRSGRQAQALKAFESLRGTLHEELGIDPSQTVTRLHRAILALDPEIDAPMAVEGGDPLDFRLAML